MHPTRRHVLTALAAMVLPRIARASTALGAATAVSGPALLTRAGADSALAAGQPLHEGDRVRTGPAALAKLLLNAATRIALGPEADLEIERWLADIGGRLTIGGAMVFDRPETLPKVDLTVVTAFGEIGVRGTRFFAGPSNGAYAVFVQRGTVEVRAGGVVRALGAGDGVNLPGAGQPPTEVAAWGAPRIAAAFASVGLRP